MQKPFRPAALESLAGWIFRELDARGTVLGLSPLSFQAPGPRLASRLFGRLLAAPLGVAAGPHSQLSQNIAAAWLCGARFIELKTVQVEDDIEVPRPCIDAEDETYNCEWSQELSLEASFREYLNAWVLVHALAHRLGLPGPGALFAMSVGYDFEGIRSPEVQGFIAAMRDARGPLSEAVEAVAQVYPPVRDLELPSSISNHVTLSTMHGCPPEEIERIARVLLEDLGLHTWIKLNPTLLGPDRLRALLNGALGFEVQIPDEAFEHDPRFPDAMAMARRLAERAARAGASFGLKLSNTLEVLNHRGVFPASEKKMYLSGRALHPLTLALAHEATEALDGQVPISFCGGADAFSFEELVADGLWPVTVCSDLLKPGGYARLRQYLLNLEAALDRAGAASLAELAERRGGARARLAEHAERAGRQRRFARRDRPVRFKGARPLDLFDCVAAPCQEACPAGQSVPDYLSQIARGEPGEALAIIERTNPLPAVTGEICERPCESACVRHHYDAPLAIRELKRFAVERGATRDPRPIAPRPSRHQRIAVVGAGPAGIAAAELLAERGFCVDLFEARKELGGMASSAIPTFRLGGQALDKDLPRLRALGVRIHLGAALGQAIAVADLRRDYDHLFLGLGAQEGRRLGIPGEEAEGVLDALELLRRLRVGAPPALGSRVLVVGGGNSAMDAARAARRCSGVGTVELVYRRTRALMPADLGELQACLEESVLLRELLEPMRVLAEEGKVVGLTCRPMELGAPDIDGRRRSVPAGGAGIDLAASSIIAAVGQVPSLAPLADLGARQNRDGTLWIDPRTCQTSVPGVFAGGDLARGPSSIVQAIADGRAAAEAISRSAGLSPGPAPRLPRSEEPLSLLARRALRTLPGLVEERTTSPLSAAAAVLEASRCLDCAELCNLCVGVCPNRAMVAYASTPKRLFLPILAFRGDRLERAGASLFELRQSAQVLNLADFCNACGNCTPFCPTRGAPFRDKPRFHLHREDFERAAGDAFHFAEHAPSLRLEARLCGRRLAVEVSGESAEYRDERICARFETRGWDLLEARPIAPLAPGELLDLREAGPLLTLLEAARALPIRLRSPP
jgi:putative selenate reductase